MSRATPWGRRWLDEIVHSLCVAPRVLRKYWKLTSIAILSLSIAMTLGIVSLSIGNTFLLLPPAARDPDRLVIIYGHTPGEDIGHIFYPDYKYYREHNHVFTDIAAGPNSIGVMQTDWGNELVKMSSRPVSENYFAVLGIRPYLGNFFSPGADRDKGASAASLVVGYFSAKPWISIDPMEAARQA
jgi:hypothetical protein